MEKIERDGTINAIEWLATEPDNPEDFLHRKVREMHDEILEQEIAITRMKASALQDLYSCVNAALLYSDGNLTTKTIQKECYSAKGMLYICRDMKIVDDATYSSLRDVLDRLIAKAIKRK